MEAKWPQNRFGSNNPRTYNYYEQPGRWGKEKTCRRKSELHQAAEQNYPKHLTAPPPRVKKAVCLLFGRFRKWSPANLVTFQFDNLTPKTTLPTATSTVVQVQWNDSDLSGPYTNLRYRGVRLRQHRRPRNIANSGSGMASVSLHYPPPTAVYPPKKRRAPHPDNAWPGFDSRCLPPQGVCTSCTPFEPNYRPNRS